MATAPAVVTAAVFTWFGMVAAISFVEAPLKFRAPNITLALGLGIGRLVFRALNIVESVLAAVIIVALIVDPPRTAAVLLVGAAIVILAVQVGTVRPMLTKRSDRVLAGEDGPRSRAHYAYVGLEVLKIIALVAGGVLLLAD